jgi:alpha-tubulin suppressor-like RCC1 family protein
MATLFALGVSGLATIPALAAPSPSAPAASVPVATPGSIPFPERSRIHYARPRHYAGVSASSSTPNPIAYHGGPVLTTPHVYLDFWGPQWVQNPPLKDAGGYTQQQAQAYMTAFFQGVGGSPLMNTVTQYCQGIATGSTSCPPGTPSASFAANPFALLKGVWNDTSPVVLTPTLPYCDQDCILGAEAAAALNHFAALNNGVVDHQGIYAVLTPHGITTSRFPSQYCGYHAYLPYFNMIWSYMPYQPDAVASDGSKLCSGPVGNSNDAFGHGWFDGFSILAGHELAESVTNPQPPLVSSFSPGAKQAWYEGSVSNELEVGDKCQSGAPYATPYGNVHLPTNYFAVQSIWSNADVGCVLGYSRRTVLPLLSSTTTVSVQNLGPVSASTSLQYFGTSGNPVGHGDATLVAPGASWVVRQDNGNASVPSTGVVYSDQPVAVAVTDLPSASADASAYRGPTPEANAGTTLYVPRYVGGRFTDAAGNLQSTTDVSLMNLDVKYPSGTVTIVYHNSDGTTAATATCGATGNPCLNALGSQDINTFTNLASPDPFTGSVSITSTAGVRLAAVVSDKGASGSYSSDLAAPASGPSGASQSLYAPLILNPGLSSTTTSYCQTGSGQIAGGYGFSITLMSDGSLLAWGDNTRGQLGTNLPVGWLGQYADHVLDSAGGNFGGVAMVAAGLYHSMALRTDGTVWTWGGNTYGQLGDGTTTDRSRPAQVPGLSQVIAIAGGGYHSLALKADGTLWAWGENQYGQLGLGNTSNVATPQQVPNFAGGIAIAGGGFHSLVIKQDGTVWTFGANGNGQLGTGSTQPAGPGSTVPVQAIGVSGATSVAAGGYHSLALLANGTVMSWGYNHDGELGNGTQIDSAVPGPVSGLSGVSVLAAGAYFHSMALKANGTAWSWGWNRLSALGNAGLNGADSWVPVPVDTLTTVTSLAGGEYHSLAAAGPDGAGWAWGDGSNYDLGSGQFQDQPTPGQIVGVGGSGVLTGIASRGCVTLTTTAVASGPHTVATLQNVSSIAGTVSVSYYDPDGNGTTRAFLIAIGGTVTIDQSDPSQGPPASARPYSAAISSDVRLVGVVSVVQPQSGTAPTTAYNMASQWSQLGSFPLVQNGGVTDFSTSLYVASATGNAAYVTLTYHDATTGALIQAAQYVIPGHGLLRLDQSKDLVAGTRANATLTATAGAPITAVAVGQGGAKLLSYNGQ